VLGEYVRVFSSSAGSCCPRRSGGKSVRDEIVRVVWASADIADEYKG
jgi:hypothetical protein